MLCDIWELYPNFVENQQGLANHILLLIKKAIRDQHKSLKMVALTYLFRLLSKFAAEKNNYAPIIYKILTFSLVEHHEDISVREHILINFCDVLERFSSMPLEVIVDPLAKLIQSAYNSTYILNLPDFQFFDVVASHTKLQTKQAVVLLDLLARIYLDQICFAHLAEGAFIKIASRFLEDEPVQEYLLEFGKLSLSKYYNSMSRRKSKDRFLKQFESYEMKHDLFIGPQHITPEMELQILHSQHRALIVNMLRDIIQLEAGNVNGQYKTLIAYSNSQIKNVTKKDDNGMKFLLGMYGNADQIIRDYENIVNPAQVKMIDYRKLDYSNVRQSSQNPLTMTSNIEPEVTIRASYNYAAAKNTEITPRKDSRAVYESIIQKAGTMETNASPREPVEAKTRVASQPVESAAPNAEVVVKGQRRARNVKAVTNNQLSVEDRETSISKSPPNPKNNRSLTQGNESTYQRKAAYRNERGQEVFLFEDFEQKNPKPTKKKALAPTERDLLLAAKAINELQEFKRKKVEEKFTQMMNEEYNKNREEKIKNTLKRKLEERKKELGVRGRSPVRDPLITETDDDISPQKLKLKMLEVPYTLESINVINFEEEEDFQKEAISICIKQNIKKFHYLHNKYSHVAGAYQKPSSFDKLKLQYNTVNSATICKFIKDFEFSAVITKEEVVHIYRLVNSKILSHEELQPLNFDGFVKFITQLAIYIYTKTPFDQEIFSYADCLKKFMDVISTFAKQRGSPKNSLDDEGHVPGGVSKAELFKLNEEIKANPNMTLPAGSKKVLENTVQYDYHLSHSLPIPKKYKIVYELLDEILEGMFQTHIIEPKALITTHMKVVGAVKPIMLQPIKRKVETEADQVMNLTVIGGREVSQEKAVKEVSKRRMSFDIPKEKPQGKIVNQVILQKIKKMEEDKKKQEELDKKRYKRQAELFEKMEEVKRAKQEAELRRIEEQRAAEKEKEEHDKWKNEMRKKELEKKKKAVEIYKVELLERIQKEEQIKKEEEQAAKARHLAEVNVQVKQKTETMVGVGFMGFINNSFSKKCWKKRK